MKQKLKNAVAFLLVVLLVMCGTPVAAKTTTYGFYASAVRADSTYQAGQPVNRVFYVTTGSSSASRTLKFEQTAGKLSYDWATTPREKSCYQYYTISVWNTDRNTWSTYYWKWSKKTSITLNRNTNYTVFVYPASLKTVEQKYLSGWKIKYGYTKSPYFTLSTQASIRYSEAESLRIAGA